jgi:hypothetical protein
MNAINTVAACADSMRATATKSRRIPYSLPMAKARRAGIKTMTRRSVSGTALEWLESGFSPDYVARPDNGLSPYGYAGDILLPVEPWRAPVEFDGLPPIQIPAGTPIWLDANGPAPTGFGRYRHGRFMPKHLIAERDEVVSVRIEYLQEISESDACAEGTEPNDGYAGPACDRVKGWRKAFIQLWRSINGDESWEANPWVWVVEFRRVTSDFDASNLVKVS